MREVAHHRRDLGFLAFEREMTGFEQVNFAAHRAACEMLRTGPIDAVDLRSAHTASTKRIATCPPARIRDGS
jgi:hypothetical protein